MAAFFHAVFRIATQVQAVGGRYRIAHSHRIVAHFTIAARHVDVYGPERVCSAALADNGIVLYHEIALGRHVYSLAPLSHECISGNVSALLHR